jgi:hypothetical protein
MAARQDSRPSFETPRKSAAPQDEVFETPRKSAAPQDEAFETPRKSARLLRMRSELGAGAARNHITPLTASSPTRRRELTEVAIDGRQAGGTSPMTSPSLYTAEIAEHILRELRAGRSLQDICLEDVMPHRDTVASWIRQDR